METRDTLTVSDTPSHTSAKLGTTNHNKEVVYHFKDDPRQQRTCLLQSHSVHKTRHSFTAACPTTTTYTWYHIKARQRALDRHIQHAVKASNDLLIMHHRNSTTWSRDHQYPYTLETHSSLVPKTLPLWGKRWITTQSLGQRKEFGRPSQVAALSKYVSYVIDWITRASGLTN